MQIYFTKISDEEHQVKIIRTDSTTEQIKLNSRSFLRHDFAHLAAELTLDLQQGYWGSVAKGSDLLGKSIQGDDIANAEALAVRLQGLMREEAEADKYVAVLKTAKPDLINSELAFKIHERARQIQGHWRSTPYGKAC